MTERMTMWYYYSVCVEKGEKMLFEVLETDRTSVFVGRVGKMLSEFCYLGRMKTCLVQMEMMGS